MNSRLLIAVGTAMVVAVSFGSMIEINSNTTFTDADQETIAASDGISIASGVTLTFNVSSALTVDKVISGGGNIAKTGTGKLHLKGDNTYVGLTTVSAGEVHTYSASGLGETEGSASYTTVSGGSVNLHNHDTGELYKLTHGDSASLWAEEGSCSLVKNPELSNVKGGFIGARADAQFNVKCTYMPSGVLSPRGEGTVCYNSDYVCPWSGWNHYYSKATLLFKKKLYNSPGRLDVYGPYPGFVKAGAKDVFNNTKIKLGLANSPTWSGGTLDLAGYSQSAVPQFTAHTGNSDSTRAICTSSQPATLRALATFGDGISVNGCSFRGSAGFIWAGSTNLEMTDLSPTEGELAVDNSSATLTIGSTGSWPNASKVSALNGTLCLSHAGAVGASTDVYVTDSGMISIPEGVTVRVRDLYIGGVKQAHGTWGSTSPAYYQDGHFTGGGVLAVSADIKLTENTTWTEAQQDLVSAASSLEIASGVTLTLNVSSGESLSIGLSVTGAGAVTKTGAGTATLGAANAYAGTTTVSGGNLIVEDVAGLGSAKADVILSGNGKLVLSYAGTASIKDLYFGSEKQIPGTWGSADSAATNKDAARFGGTGMVGVSANVIIDANTTWTEAQQTLVDAADSIEILNGVTLTVDLAEGKELSIGTVILGAGALVKNGAGDLKLSGANTYTGVTTVNAGKLHVYSNAGLGATDMTSSYTQVNGGSVYLHNVTVDESFHSSLNTAGVWGAEGTSTVTGQPDYKGNGGFFGALADCQLNVNCTYLPGGHLTPQGEGTIVYGSSYLHPYGGWYHNSATTVYLNKSLYLSSEVNYRIFYGNGIVPKLHLGANNVLGTIRLTMGNAPNWSNSELYLDGHSQEKVVSFTAKPGETLAQTPHVFSSSPATLRALASDIPSNACVFAEHAGFIWAGTTDLELCVPSSTDGELCAESGTLTIGANGSWTNATKVTVGGGASVAKLVLTHKKSLGRDSVVDIRTNGKLEIPAGVAEHVGELRFNGVKVPDGVYGSTSSRAMEKDDNRFSGAGVLKVGDVGMHLIVR